MAKLVIVRSNEYINRLRAIGVYIDDKKYSTIANGQTLELDVPEGMHVLRTKIDWCGSRNHSFFISEGETKTIFLSSFGYKSRFILVSFCILAMCFAFQYFLDINIFFVPVLMSAILVYFFTIGRNQYLRTKEI